MRKKINITLLCINIVLLAAFGIMYLITGSLGKAYGSNAAKQQWDGGKYQYAQLSAYFSESANVTAESIRTLRASINSKLMENSVALDDNSDGRLWIDCYYTEATLTLKSDRSTCTAAVGATGGDFFIFHPLELLYGSYYTDEDINYDRLVIDKECSWQLFGSTNSVGLPVTIGTKTFYVAAVVSSPDSDIEKAAYGTSPRVYMPLEAMTDLYGERESPTVITAYEVCLPELVSDFACGILTDCMTVSEESRIIVDQTSRFNIITLSNGFSAIAEDAMTTKAIALPWFENIIRAGELKAKLIAGPAVRILIIPLISTVYGIFVLAKLIGKGVRRIVGKIEQRYQKRISEEYYRKKAEAQGSGGRSSN